jgi:hypothetical protein
MTQPCYALGGDLPSRQVVVYNGGWVGIGGEHWRTENENVHDIDTDFSSFKVVTWRWTISNQSTC